MRPVVEILRTRLASGNADSRSIRQESRNFAGKVNAVARFGDRGVYSVYKKILQIAHFARDYRCNRLDTREACFNSGPGLWRPGR